MSRFLTAALVGTIVLFSSIAQAQTVEERLAAVEKELATLKDAKTFKLYWKDGIRFDSHDGNFKMKLGGRIQNDWAWFSLDDDVEDAVGDVEDGTEFRRARIAISGTTYKVLEYKAQYDFAGGDVDFKDVYVGHKDVPIAGKLRIGHFKEPFGLEELTSSKHITFMERSLTSPYAPSRNSGIMAHRRICNDSTQVQIGFFRDTDDFGFDQDDGGYNGTVRVAAVPIYEDDGKKILHIGGAATYRNQDSLRHRERPEAHLSVRFVDTGTFAIEDETRVGGELAVVCGPLSFQSEVMYSGADGDGVGNVDTHAFYIMGSYFLTKESRPYKKDGAIFSNVKPKQNAFDGDGGIGAWETAARFSRIDLGDNDPTIDGGELTDVTLALNWYLNPNYRVSWNYVWAHLASEGDANIFQMRFQVAW